LFIGAEDRKPEGSVPECTGVSFNLRRKNTHPSEISQKMGSFVAMFNYFCSELGEKYVLCYDGKSAGD
jgi:hypothetical protein